MDAITFRTTDNTRWGPGQGSNLSAAQIDINFWVLYTAVLALQEHQESSAGISNFIVSGDTFSVQLDNHLVLGPFNLPVAAFNFRGPFQADAAYNINDIFQATNNIGQSALFLVIWPVPNAGATFFQGANDGNGHNYFTQMIAAPLPELPQDGNAGAFLRMTQLDSPGSVEWESLTRNIGIYLETAPDPNEEIVRYCFTEETVFPEALAFSQGNVGTGTSTGQQYAIFWNDALVGTINVAASPGDEVTFTFNHEITFMPGDVLVIVAPSAPDPHMTKFCFTLVGII